MEHLLSICLIVWAIGVGLMVVYIAVQMIRSLFDKTCDGDNFNLTKEDFDFLIELQHEMLTQDHVSQAAPRFWVVATDKYQELGTEECFDGTNLYSSDEADVLCAGDMASILEYVIEHYPEEMEGFAFIDQCRHYTVTFGEDEDREEETIFCSEELLDFLKEHNVITDDYELIYYRNVHHIYPNTMFLTNRSCKEHIKANYYHYNGDAHSYAMTAWRSPEVERLWKILDVIDWKTMRRMAYGYESDAERASGETDAKEHIEGSGSSEQS